MNPIVGSLWAGSRHDEPDRCIAVNRRPAAWSRFADRPVALDDHPEEATADDLEMQALRFEFFLSHVQALVGLIRDRVRGCGLYLFFVFTVRLFAVFLGFALLRGCHFPCFAGLGFSRFGLLLLFAGFLFGDVRFFFGDFCGLERRRVS
jgi:hypothetical protein